ncbi:hypothetical protein [Olivibacter sp. XZL3]|nr:hypothetical protein [Olivibacter sp. XZL3]
MLKIPNELLQFESFTKTTAKKMIWFSSEKGALGDMSEPPLYG